MDKSDKDENELEWRKDKKKTIISKFLFRNTTCMKESEHSFPSENPIKMGGEEVGCLCKIKWPLVQEKVRVTVWKQGWWGIN